MSENHFTQDEDLLEQYVLGRLGEHDRIRYEHHLRQCEICQRAVREEQRIAAGAKQLGRQQLKEHLRRIIGATVPRTMPWLGIAGVAAALVVIIGMGVVFRWWESNRLEDQEAITDLRNEESSARPLEQQKPAEPETEKLASNAPSPSATSGGAKSERRDQRADKGEEFASSKEAVAADEAGTKNLGEGAGDRGRLDAVASRRVQQDALGKVESNVRQSSNEIWVQGIVLPAPVLPGTVEQSFGVPRPEKEKREKDREMKSDKKSTVRVNAESAAQFAVRQQPFRTLPSALQQQAVSVQRTVQTMIRQEDGKISMTLYLDSLVGDRDLRTAEVEYVATDSLILHLSEQRIGYRIPSGWIQRSTSTGITK